MTLMAMKAPKMRAPMLFLASLTAHGLCNEERAILPAPRFMAA